VLAPARAPTFNLRTLWHGYDGAWALSGRAVGARSLRPAAGDTWPVRTPYRSGMTHASGETVQAVSELLHQAAETHHVVFAISDGDDPDWASWYADWLVTLSALPRTLGRPPVRSELTWLLVGLDREFTRDKPDRAWEMFYAQRLVQHFTSTS